MIRRPTVQSTLPSSNSSSFRRCTSSPDHLVERFNNTTRLRRNVQGKDRYTQFEARMPPPSPQAPPESPARVSRSSGSSSPLSTGTSLDDLQDIDRINTLRPMYDPSLPIAEQLNSMELSGEEPDVKSEEKTKVVRRFPEEEEEDILRETSDRFVLFPIKYREVCLRY